MTAPRRVTVTDLQAMRDRGERIAMLTAYDYSTARIADQAGIPILLVSANAVPPSTLQAMNELGFRTPLVLSWPGHVDAGVVRDDLVSSLDVPAATAS